MLMFGWDFEVVAWSKFWRWTLIKICLRNCDMNSTLGSVAPFAMFKLLFVGCVILESLIVIEYLWCKVPRPTCWWKFFKVRRGPCLVFVLQYLQYLQYLCCRPERSCPRRGEEWSTLRCPRFAKEIDNLNQLINLR